MKIVSIATSKKKGTPKTTIGSAKVVKNHGIDGDAHAGPWHRQVSLLAIESIDKAKPSVRVGRAHRTCTEEFYEVYECSWNVVELN